MLSPFWMPVMTPPKEGFAAPYGREALLAVTVSGAGVTVKVPLVMLTM